VRGLQILEHLFPGLTKELEDAGAGFGGPENVRIYVLGWRLRYKSDLRLLSVTRPFLEWNLLRRIRALPNTTICERTEVAGLIGDKARITGVSVSDASGARDLTADFIVDARGRASNLADWMKTLGAETPPHETSPLGSRYSSAMFEHAENVAPPFMHQVACMKRRMGALIFPVENNRVLVSIGANTDVEMPKTHPEMLALLATLPVPDAHDVVKALKPVTQPVQARFIASVRRNFDRLSSPPEGIVAIGDAVASFNPIFGQGMTIAALEAEWLEKRLQSKDPAAPGFARAYYAGVKPIVDLAWGLPDLEAKRGNPKAQSWPTRFLLWYTMRVQYAATRSAYVSERLAHIQNMLLPPAALFSPSMFFRVVFA
jgi:2-polyprenyl-6-methoxyphenol hydroxylase-like FAD-dependent oxidoreductase